MYFQGKVRELVQSIKLLDLGWTAVVSFPPEVGFYSSPSRPDRSKKTAMKRVQEGVFPGVKAGKA
jgi:hypothetical protein